MKSLYRLLLIRIFIVQRFSFNNSVQTYYNSKQIFPLVLKQTRQIFYDESGLFTENIISGQPQQGSEAGCSRPTFWQTCTSDVNHEDMDN